MVGSWIPTQIASGGSGLRYTASTIIYFSKSKDRDLKDKKVVNGIIVKAVVDKSRFTKSYTKAELRIDFQKGLDKYHGLADIAIKYDIFKKTPTGSYEISSIPGRKLSLPDIQREADKIYTKEILDQIDAACAKEFKLGTAEMEENESIDDENNVELTDETETET